MDHHGRHHQIQHELLNGAGTHILLLVFHTNFSPFFRNDGSIAPGPAKVKAENVNFGENMEIVAGQRPATDLLLLTFFEISV